MNDSKNFSGQPISEMVASPPPTAGRVDKVTRLDVRFEAPGIESKKLYANGRMQVRVWVFIAAVDADGDDVPLSFYPDLISVKLIQYHNGLPLRSDVYTDKPLPGWNSSRFENTFSHETPGGIQSAAVDTQQSGSRNEPLVFWVSSSAVGQAQIAAEVTLQGKTYRSNNTTNPDGKKINKSIIIQADAKPTYAISQFRMQAERVGSERDGDSLYRYFLGLYPNERQVKLVAWESTQYNNGYQYPILFCNTGLINNIPGVKSFCGEFPLATAKKVQVNLPENQYVADINQRSGELTFVQGVSTKYPMSSPVRTAPFYFTVTDELGNDHKLSIAINVNNAAFTLQRG